MSYRQHRSHLRYAAVEATPRPIRRLRRAEGFALPSKTIGQPASDAMLGILYGVPAGLVLWLAAFGVVRAFL